jgi:periplasmic copper chaperone A
MRPVKMEGGIAKMRPVKGGLEIKPGETVELKPGSLHVMFVGLKKPLSAGDQVKATLVFEKAGSVNVDYDVRAMGSQPAGAMPGMKH